MKEKYEVGDPKVNLLDELLGKTNYYVLYSTMKNKPLDLKPYTPKHLPPYYQNVLSFIHNLAESSSTIDCDMDYSEFPPISDSLVLNCYMFFPISSDHVEDFSILKNFELP